MGGLTMLEFLRSMFFEQTEVGRLACLYGLGAVSVPLMHNVYGTDTGTYVLQNVGQFSAFAESAPSSNNADLA